MRPSTIIPQFDAHLKEAGLSFEGIVIGGAALDLLGVMGRETNDCDVLDPEIPQAVLEAAKIFAHKMALPMTSLRETWLNNGPATLVPHLPKGWRMRLTLLFQGEALILHGLARPDLLATKLLAFCDRGQDLFDCLAMKPTREELLLAQPWMMPQDGNPSWAAHVQESLTQLAKRLGYEL